ncbi:unnamed protein product, partial [Clonostachys rhizophaga]
MDFASMWDKYLVQLVLRRNPVAPTKDGRQIPLCLSSVEPDTLVDERRRRPYISNAIRTTTYTIWDFLPRQLVYQFTRLANSYLLIVAILQVIPGLSTTGSFTTLIPLVIFVTMIITKEGYYDWKRHRQDVAENNRLATVLRSSTSQGHRAKLQWVATKWQDFRVGEVIKLSSGDEVPADIVLLHATGDRGLAFVETMALDGETNLKAKRTPTNLGDCDTIDNITQRDVMFSIEDPNPDLYRFDSKLTSQSRTLPLTLNEAIYRGSVIRNTPEAIGIVVNTGEECKVRMNSKVKAESKKPRLEQMTNFIVATLIFFIILLSSLATVAYIIWKGQSESRAWYLFDSTVPMVQIFFGFVIMFNNVIPLSLYVGLEGIKIGQMTMIYNDVQLHDEKSDTPARVNTTNNLDDLGQIGYLFTDKTGTLTDNIMNFHKLSVAGASWLHKNCLAPGKNSLQGLSGDVGEFTTRNLLEYVHSETHGRLAASVKQFLLVIALCHTCLPVSGESGETEFQASSPDELALFSSKRKRMSIILRCPNGTNWLVCKGADSAILPRLPMAPRDMVNDLAKQSYPSRETTKHSPIIRGHWRSAPSDQSESPANDQDSATSIPFEEDMIPLRDNMRQAGKSDVCDNQNFHTIIGTTAATEDEETNCIRQSFGHMNRYATEGLRTLVYAGRTVSEREYLAWKRLYHKAETDLQNRRERMEEVGEMMEKSLHFLGITAVEDKLQQEVPETIEKLRRARVKIWMLTGDKRETAISIAHSARICGPDTSLYFLDVAAGDLEFQLNSISDYILCSANPASHSAVVVDGATLTAIEEDPDSRVRHLFYQLAPNIGSVICCRASPSQKALLVRVIGDDPLAKIKRGRWSCLWSWRKSHRPLTLAIGDGANDVPMILTASVGVGISGREGQQAARVADFSISQFRFLARLMLVHGRWNYHRTTRFILVTFWKEVLFYFPQAIFQGEAGSTGTSLYHSQALMFTSYLTAAAILVIGMYEQDLKANTLLAIPQLYAYGQNGEGLTSLVYLGWMSNALTAGFIIFAVCWAAYSGGVPAVYDNGLYAQGTLVFACCMIWTNYKVLILEMHHKTKIALWSASVSILAVWLYIVITGLVAGYESGPYAITGGIIEEYGRDPSWWLALLYTLGLLTAAEWAHKSFRQNAMVRDFVGRCCSWFGVASDSKEGVREGFKAWDTRLWQEIEKDKGVRAHFRSLDMIRKSRASG